MESIAVLGCRYITRRKRPVMSKINQLWHQINGQMSSKGRTKAGMERRVLANNIERRGGFIKVLINSRSSVVAKRELSPF